MTKLKDVIGHYFDKDFMKIEIDDINEIFVLSNIINCRYKTGQKFKDFIAKKNLEDLYKDYPIDSEEYIKQKEERERLINIPDYDFKIKGEIAISTGRTAQFGSRIYADIDIWQYTDIKTLEEDEYDYDHDYHYDWDEEKKLYINERICTFLANVGHGNHINTIVTDFSDVFRIHSIGGLWKSVNVLELMTEHWKNNLMDNFYARYKKSVHHIIDLLNYEIQHALNQGLEIDLSYWDKDDYKHKIKIHNILYDKGELKKFFDEDKIKEIYYKEGKHIKKFPKANCTYGGNYTHSHLGYYEEYVEGNEANEIIYTGAFIQEDLFQKYSNDWNHKYADHMTVSFKPKELNISVGEKVTLKITGRLTTDEIDVLLVDNDISTNEHPHITLATKWDMNPSKANYVLATNQDKIVPLDDTVEAVYGYFGYKDGAGGIFTEHIEVE